MPLEYFDEIEFELFQYEDDSDSEEYELDPEEWQDFYSEDLLNVWMSIVEYHENWYIPLKKTFNQMCEFIFQDAGECEIITHEIQAIRNHPFVKGRNWEYFFSE